MTMAPNQRVCIRRATSTDAELITGITDAAYTKYLPRLGRRPQPMTVDYHQILAMHPVWLLCIDDQPVGVLVLMHDPNTLLIYSVAIHPHYQQQGFGRQLLAWGEHEARAAGYTHIRLFTNALMKENITLYTHLGYRETSRESYQGSTLVHLAKDLA